MTAGRLFADERQQVVFRPAEPGDGRDDMENAHISMPGPGLMIWC